MGTRCEEPHCLQIIPTHLFQSHQDQHLAERLAAEDFEQQQQVESTDEELARSLAVQTSQHNGSFGDDENSDYEFALALNREFRTEEEERSWKNVQVHRLE